VICDQRNRKAARFAGQRQVSHYTQTRCVALVLPHPGANPTTANPGLVDCKVSTEAVLTAICKGLLLPATRSFNSSIIIVWGCFSLELFSHRPRA